MYTFQAFSCDALLSSLACSNTANRNLDGNQEDAMTLLEQHCKQHAGAPHLAMGYTPHAVAFSVTALLLHISGLGHTCPNQSPYWDICACGMSFCILPHFVSVQYSSAIRLLLQTSYSTVCPSDVWSTYVCRKRRKELGMLTCSPSPRTAQSWPSM